MGRRQEKPNNDLREICTCSSPLLQAWHTGQLQTQGKITIQILTRHSPKEQEIIRKQLRLKWKLLQD